MKLVAFHGFLGRAQDFDPFVQILRPEWSFIPDLYGENEDLIRSGFEDFLNQVIDHLESSTDLDGPFQLLGYSFGGRLALHLALKRPDLFDRVILLSTHPGLFESQEVAERRIWEKNWVAKIQTESWESWTQEWLNQELFAGDAIRTLKEGDFSKTALLKSIELFSNTNSSYSIEDFKELQKSLTWVTGGKDHKFLHWMEKVQEWRPHRDQHLLVAEAGHRLIANEDLAWLSTLFS